MKKKAIQSDRTRSRLLETIHTHREATDETGKRYLPTEIASEVETRHLAFQQAIEEREQATQAARRARARRDEATENLVLQVRTFQTMLIIRKEHGLLEPADLEGYGLGPNGKRPRISNKRDCLHIARRLIEGDLVSEARGKPKMTEPSREVLETALAETETAITESETATLRLQETMEETKRQREEARLITGRVSRLLDAALYGQDPTTRRQTKRVFGFEYTPTNPEPAADPIS